MFSSVHVSSSMTHIYCYIISTTTHLLLQHTSCSNMPSVTLFCFNTPILLQHVSCYKYVSFYNTYLLQHSSVMTHPLPQHVFVVTHPFLQHVSTVTHHFSQCVYCYITPMLQHIFLYYAHLLQHKTHVGIITSTVASIHNPLCYLQHSIPFDCAT
jgi:hypothetical protein